MHTLNHVTPDDFVHSGFAILPEFLKPGEVAEMQMAVEYLLDSPPVSTCSRPNNTLLPLRWNHRIVEIALASKHRVDVLTDALRANDLKWISGYVSIKHARSPALWWHQDWWCWDHPVSFQLASPQVAVLCYLSATTVHNGALRILPGTHRRSSPLHASLPEPTVHGTAHIEPTHIVMSDHADQLTLSVGVGDAVAIDYRLLHGTHGNASDARRDCVILNFTPSWRDLPSDIQGHLISHPALPWGDERPVTVLPVSDLLPRFGGPPCDLPVNRMAPHHFEIPPV
jgi:Phytanoyl-CoA dioxygenase (PhyH)